MNFYVDKNKGGGVDYIWVHIHPKKLILNFDHENHLYEHDELETALEDISKWFEEKSVNSIREYIIDNFKHQGINVNVKPKKPKTEGEQFKLF